MLLESLIQSISVHSIFYLIGAVVIYILAKKWIEFSRAYEKLKNFPQITYDFPLGSHYSLSRKGDMIANLFHLLLGMTQIFLNETSVIFWNTFQPIWIVIKAETAEKIFSSTVHIEKSFEYQFLHPWLMTGLLTSGGQKWARRRKMLTPTFHFNILEVFFPIMCEQSNVLVKILREKVTAKEDILDVVPLITNCALDIICETAMGTKLQAQKHQNLDYVSAIHRVGHNFMKRALKPWTWNSFIYYYLTPEGISDRKDLKTLHAFTTNVIKERKQLLKRKAPMASNDDHSTVYTKKRLAFSDLLIEQHLQDEKAFTELDIREEVDTFMFEGHDTTAMSLIWTLFLLGTHPEIQEKLHKELDMIDNIEQLDIKQLKELKYLEGCIKESLRLFPSVPIVGRKLHQDFPIDGQVIPKGATVIIFLYAIQRDPKFFPKPECFIPERFVDGSCYNATNPFSYAPFSAGPRNCIGQKFAIMEEKVILAHILYHFRLESQLNRDKLLVNPEMVLRPAIPIPIRFIPRR